MPKGPRGEKRLADVIGAAVMVGRIATGEIEDTKTEKNPRKYQDMFTRRMHTSRIATAGGAGALREEKLGCIAPGHSADLTGRRGGCRSTTWSARWYSPRPKPAARR